jgi:GH25 family lysozyme M1 (1,4-beta-N-acetylmuramidase)
MTDYGIDVSAYNTITDWTAVRGAGNTWAWSKATQGGSYTNSLFASQMRSGLDADLRMGAYHFPDPNVSVAANVAHFVAVAGPAGAFEAGAMAPMLDVEDDPGDGITWTAAMANAFIPQFRDALRAATGQHLLVVYAPQSWWASGMLAPDSWADDEVFLCAARYGVAPGDVGWSHPRLAIHQYTDAAPTPGSAKPTDRSVTVGGWTLADLLVGGQEEDMAGFWFIGNQTTGDVALLYPNGDFVGVNGSNYSAVITANQIPKLDVPQEVWDDMRTRRANDRQAFAAELAAVVGKQPAVQLDPTAVGQALATAEGPQIAAAFTQTLSGLPTALAQQILSDVREALDKAGV